MSSRKSPLTDPNPLRSLLDALEPKPDVGATREEKHGYAVKMSRALAALMADALRPKYPNILPTAEDVGHESLTGSSEGKKKLDVKVWDDSLGLTLLVSIKAYSFKDWDSKKKNASRYTKNIKRNGMELKDEADVIHRRQPYSVMVAIMFMPTTACDDGDPKSKSDVHGASSFASAVKRLRVRTGRALDPDEKRFERYDLTEQLYIGLYEYDDPKHRGSVRFFNVQESPPKTGRPGSNVSLSLKELVEAVAQLVHTRNTTGIEWATLTEEAELDELDA